MNLCKNKEWKSLLFKCRASCFHFLEISYIEEELLEKWPCFCVNITAGDKPLLSRIKAAWQALKGSRYGASEEIILYKKDLEKLKKWLDKILSK